MEKLEVRELEFETMEEFLAEIKREFGREEEESVKAAELRKMEQRRKTMEEFVQEFKRAARESRYEGRLLVEEFKRGMSRTIRRKLMETEDQLGSIEQWYSVKFTNGGLSFSLFYFPFSFSFHFIFLFFYF